jgi:integrase
MRRGQPGRLSPLRLKQLAKTEGLHADGGQLYLAVTRNKNTGALRQSWVFLYVKRGARHMIGGGSMYTVSLAQAREWAREQRLLLIRGQDPLTVKREGEQAAAAAFVKMPTFDEARDKYLNEHESKWKTRSSRHAWEATLTRYVTPVFGKLAVKDIDRALVIRALEPVWKRTPETAARIRGRIEAILDYAAVSGLREGENPASWKLLKHKFPNHRKTAAPNHVPSMDYREVPAFVAELQGRSEVPAAALLFGILTCTRSQEFRGARWGAEIDIEERTWTIPGTRMKSGREHRVPLSAAAMAVLKRMAEIRQNEFVFPGQHGGPVSKDALRRLMHRMGRGDCTRHGFRSSASTWRAEKTKFDAEVMEAVLAHVLPDQVARAYQRGTQFEKRRRVMDAWADFLDGAEPRVAHLRAISS